LLPQFLRPFSPQLIAGVGHASMRPPIIRPERSDDAGTIRRVTYEAFKSMPFADGDEHELVGALRDSGALDVSLVADLDGQIIGHIAISPAISGDGSTGWYALGPVSVLPEHQRRGVGSALITEAMLQLEAYGARGCILTGDPNYYTRFGFERTPESAPAEEPAEYFMIKIISAGVPQGRFRFHEAFHGAA
jgi:putative acetyltransferase